MAQDSWAPVVSSTTVVDRGHGVPLVLLPGIQGRWEYMRRTVDALSEHFRVITFSLCGERASRFRYDPSRGLDSFVDQIDVVLDARGVRSAMVCGVSFGGLIALRFAASRPARTRGLVLASTPGPGWHLRRRHDVYARLPWIFGPVFLVETPWRVRRELRTAVPNLRERQRFRREQLRTFLRAPVSPARIAERARLIAHVDAGADCRLVTAPTLVITGERALDHVVAVEGASAYGRLIRGAQTVVVNRTGHLGCVTRPHAFAAHIHEFWNQVGSVGSTAAPMTDVEQSEAHDAA